MTMSLSPETATFCDNWRAKAHSYSTTDVRDAFDKFFTLYVVFNRLYAEATFRLARRGCAKLSDRFPDWKGSQAYVLQFCGATRLIDAWDNDSDTSSALREIADRLREGRFALKLDMVTGDRRPNADLALLAALESRSRDRRAKAGLETLYAIRCNMFHGHKGFDPIQIELLRPALLLLESTINVLRHKLEEDGG
jgi:hypothetical protein